MRQAIYDPVFEVPDLATFTAGMKARYFNPQHLVWDADIHGKLSYGMRHL